MNMAQYMCLPCGYIFDENNESQDKHFDQLSVSWVCPECGSGKHEFEEVEIKNEQQ